MNQVPITEDNDAVDSNDDRHRSWICDGLWLSIQLDRLFGQKLFQVQVEVPEGVIDANGGHLGALDVAKAVNLKKIRDSLL